jgi:hypothetical protein
MVCSTISSIPRALTIPNASISAARHSHIIMNAFFLPILLLSQMSTSAIATLPPGYSDDHLMCRPASACLRPVPHTRGWTGPRAWRYECCDPVSGEVSRPRGWGWKLGAEYLAQLFKQGYTLTTQCTVRTAERCGVKIGVKLESAVDRLLGIGSQLLM